MGISATVEIGEPDTFDLYAYADLIDLKANVVAAYQLGGSDGRQGGRKYVGLTPGLTRIENIPVRAKRSQYGGRNIDNCGIRLSIAWGTSVEPAEHHILSAIANLSDAALVDALNGQTDRIRFETTEGN